MMNFCTCAEDVQLACAELILRAFKNQTRDPMAVPPSWSWSPPGPPPCGLVCRPESAVPRLPRLASSTTVVPRLASAVPSAVPSQLLSRHVLTTAPTAVPTAVPTPDKEPVTSAISGLQADTIGCGPLGPPFREEEAKLANVVCSFAAQQQLFS